MELSKSIVHYCQGNPLALVVLGCFLCGRGKREWESALDKLNQDPPKHIVDVLKVSFDELDDKQQNVFLDLSFFIKEGVEISLNTIRQIHGSSADIDMSVLRERSLISFDLDGYIEMHDLVKEMGLQIARQQSFSDCKCLVRLWRPEDVDDFFMCNKGEGAIRCLSVDMSKIKWRTFGAIKLQKMYNLIYLKVYKSDGWKSLKMNIGEDVDYLPEGLRFLSWERCPLSYVPLNSCAQNLVEFRMRDSYIQQLWNGDVLFPNLKVIDVGGSRCLTALPNLSQAPNIESLHAVACVSLDQIHSSTVLPKLSHLQLYESRGKQIKLGGTMKGIIAGLVCVVNYLDLRRLSLNKVSMKVLAREEGRIIYGVGYKHVEMRLENREMADLKMGAQRLACLLPFVKKVDWSHGPVEFGDFNHCYTSHFYFLRSYRPFHDSLVVEVRRRGGQRGEVGPLRREMVNHDNDKGVEEEEELMPQISNTETPLIRFPSGITRWSLLTELRLKESEVIGNAGSSSIPQVSILRSLVLSQSHKRTPPLLDLSLPLDISPFTNLTRSLYLIYSTPPTEVEDPSWFRCQLDYGVDHFYFCHYDNY